MSNAQMMATGLIGIMVAVIVFTVLNGVVNPMTTAQTVTGEGFNTTVAGTESTLANDNVVPASEVVYNESDDSVFSSPDDYNLTDATGIINMSHVVAWEVNYSYYDDTYLTNGTTRSMFDYILLLMVVAIIVSVAYMIRT